MFTPIHSLLGADLLHLSTSHHLELTGRPLGISGILNGAVLGDRETWRWAFIAGLVGSALVGDLTSIAEVGWGVHRYGLEDGLTGGSVGRRVLAGILVGFGSKVSVSRPDRSSRCIRRDRKLNKFSSCTTPSTPNSSGLDARGKSDLHLSPLTSLQTRIHVLTSLPLVYPHCEILLFSTAAIFSVECPASPPDLS
jgi:hypothetical protein